MEANLWKKLGLMIQLHDDFRLSIFCVISYLYFVLYCKSCKRKVTLKNVSTNWLLDLRVVHYKNEKVTVMKLTFLFGKTCYNIKVCATKCRKLRNCTKSQNIFCFLLLLLQQQLSKMQRYIRLQIKF